VSKSEVSVIEIEIEIRKSLNASESLYASGPSTADIRF